MLGLPEALMSFIRRQVGTRTDAADANGSLHAKIKQSVITTDALIKSNLASSTTKKPKIACYANNGARNTWRNVVSISSSGWLTGVSVSSEGETGNVHLRIILDGTTVLDTQASNNVVFVKSDVSGYLGEGISAYPFRANSLNLTHRFNTSLAVQILKDSDSGTMRCHVAYVTDS